MPERATEPEQATSTGPEDWITYDPATGPGLDPDRWQPLRLPPGRGDHAAVDPAAQVAVGDGTVSVDLPRFTTSDDISQPFDSAKHVLVSTATVEVGDARTFAVDLDVHNVGGDPADYRPAFAAFHVVDTDVTRRSFSVCGTSTRVLALHEQVGPASDPGLGPPFFHMVEAPYADFDDDVTRPRRCEITLDRDAGRVSWQVDGQPIYFVEPTVVPERVRLGFGLWSQLPLRNGRSRSLLGQGMRADWHWFRYC